MGILAHGTRLLAVIAALLLVSCIDGREEFWFHADGSGRAEITYTLPSAAATLQGGEAGVLEMINGFLTAAPAIKNPQIAITNNDGRMTVNVRYAFDSALELASITEDGLLETLPPSATALSGQVDVQLRGRNIHFSRLIDAGKALPGSSFMPASRFDGHQLDYIIHLPLPATESNAGKLSDNGRTLEWNFPLSLAIRTPLTMTFQAPAPIPPWAWAILALLLAILTFLVFRLLKNRRPRNPPKTHAPISISN